MTQIALNDAKEKLVELVDAVGRGEVVVITRDGKPVAKILPADAQKPKRVFGSAQGMIRMADDFDAPLDDFAEYM
jgi:prevent-host-death family protein